MKQIIPNGFNPLRAAGTRAATGARKLGGIIRLFHNTGDAIEADGVAAEQAQNECQAAIAARIAATAAQAAMNAQAVTFITVVRDLLKPKLGSRYSRAWNEVGFINQNLWVPRKCNQQLGLLRMIELFYRANPAQEVAGTATEALAGDLFNRFLAAQDAVAFARSDARVKKAARDAAVAALKARLRNLNRELKQLLAPDDPRWLEFGFNIPAAKTQPDPVQNAVLTVVAADKVSVKWEMPAGATYIRVSRQVVGADENFVHVKNVNGSECLLDGFAPGQTVRVQLVAANETGYAAAIVAEIFIAPLDQQKVTGVDAGGAG